MIKHFLQRWLNKFEERKNFLIKFFQSINGFDVYDHRSFLYLLDVKALLKKYLMAKVIENDIDFSEYILTDSRVAVVPGIAFGKSPYFRISYATSMNDLQQACKKIEKSIAKII